MQLIVAKPRSLVDDVVFECLECTLLFVGPQTNGLPSIIRLVMNYPLFITILVVISASIETNFDGIDANTPTSLRIQILKLGSMLHII